MKEGVEFKQVYNEAIPIETINDWQMIETEIEVGQETESFYITQTDYIGDFLIDRFYFINMNTWQNCRYVNK